VAEPVPTSAAFKLPQKRALTYKFFAPLGTTDMNTETGGAQHTLPQQEAPRKSGRPPPTVITSATNFTRFQGELKDHAKGEYKLRNSRNGTSTAMKEMADYSAIKSFLNENNLHCFTFSPNSEKTIKATIHRLPPGHTSGSYFQLP
jgi:hypothetical protein